MSYKQSNIISNTGFTEYKTFYKIWEYPVSNENIGQTWTHRTILLSKRLMTAKWALCNRLKFCLFWSSFFLSRANHALLVKWRDGNSHRDLII
jgi:hypothetical protein